MFPQTNKFVRAVETVNLIKITIPKNTQVNAFKK